MQIFSQVSLIASVISWRNLLQKKGFIYPNQLMVSNFVVLVHVQLKNNDLFINLNTGILLLCIFLFHLLPNLTKIRRVSKEKLQEKMIYFISVFLLILYIYSNQNNTINFRIFSFRRTKMLKNLSKSQQDLRLWLSRSSYVKEPWNFLLPTSS